MKLIDRIILNETKSHWRKLFTVFCLIVLTIGFDLLSPWPFKILIDNVLSPVATNETGLILVLINFFHSRYMLGVFAVFLYFISTSFNTLFEYIQSTVTKGVIKDSISHFSKRAFKSLESVAIGFYNEQQIGDFIYRLSYDVNALGELLESGILPLVTSSVHLAIAIVVMCLISVKLTLFALVALPFLVSGTYLFNHYISDATKRSEKFNSSIFSFIEEALTHLRVVQAFSQEKRESERFNRKVDTMTRSDLGVFKLDFLLTLMVGLVIAVSYSVVILYGMSAVFAGTITTGLFIVFIFYLDNLTNPMLAIVYAAASLREEYTKIARMEDFFSVKRQLQDVGTRRLLRGHGIRFDSVSVLGEEGKNILKDVSFDIDEGKCTVILGVSGSGKTSLTNLIMRFIDKPDSGRVLIGGIDINEYDPKAIRNAIAYVPQEISLFDDTIYNNLIFGNPKASRKDIKDALYAADAEDFIHQLPGKYNFRVGEGGTFLSGGQKQRLMLARALLRKRAPILLLDEVFSALDVKTRKKVLERLQEVFKGKTVIIISNVFDVVEQADMVVVLNKGEIVYKGKKGGLPREISLYKILLK